MPLGARRTFRLSLVTALSLALAYGLGVQFPFFAPLFGFLLTSAATPPPGVKGLLGLLLVVTIALGVGTSSSNKPNKIRLVRYSQLSRQKISKFKVDRRRSALA